MMNKYPDLFKAYKPLKGSDWIKSLPEEDRRVFIDIGQQEFLHGWMGGKARAATAKRDHRGRFAKIDGTNHCKEPKNWGEES